MQNLVEYMVKHIVDNPQDVSIKEVQVDDKNIDLELRVNEEDLGRVIGKRGKVAQSIRNVIKAASLKKDMYYNLKIIEND